MVRISSSEGESTSTVTVSAAGRTSGRTASVCGQIGVATMQSTEGATIGPPAESE
jgi:UDP-N-acetylmuramoylalanine-D-glutamate ligase